MGRRLGRALAVAVVLAATGLPVAPARADLGSLLAPASCQQRDALDNSLANGAQLPYRFCDDGVPNAGGVRPNTGAVSALAVPAKYDGVAGLPAQAADAATVPGADPLGHVALDADLSVPDPARFPPPPGGYPLVVMMHGCCSGNKTSWERSTIEPGDSEGWHYSNAWFASRGYLVLTYTARGFVSSDSDGNRGSTGQTQIDDLRYELNDFQELAGMLADEASLHVDPQRVVATGGSYGGGFSWLALVDPLWRSRGGLDMRLAAVAPKYGWTDLVNSLLPNGAERRDALPAFDGATTTRPLGFPKQSIVAGLYVSGKTGVPPGTGSHATFPPEIDEASACQQSADPFESNPLCANAIANTLPQFLRYHSAYYQDAFFDGLRAGTIPPIPVFSAGTFTDPLFTSREHRRMADRLQATVAGYPVQEYYGDYQHFTQNKAREWGDVCGADRHVCRFSDYPGGDLNADPAGLVRRGVTVRLNRFVDHYALPQGDPSQPVPGRDVTAALQVCDDTAGLFGLSPADAGPQFTAASFGALAPNTLHVQAAGDQSTSNTAAPNTHAAHADPVANQVGNSTRCVVESSPGANASAGPGVATYDSDPLGQSFTMIGQTRVTVTHSAGSGSGLQIDARLYDLDPASGRQILVDRGPSRPAAGATGTIFDLQGNGWRFARGHRVRIELSQDDAPYIKSSVQPSSLTLHRVTLQIPIRESSASIGGRVAPFGQRVILRAPRLASDTGTSRFFGLSVSPRGARAADLARYEVQVLPFGTRRWRSLGARGSRMDRRARSAFRYGGAFGRTYRFRARAVSRAGNRGPWAYAVTVVPFDDRFRAAHYAGAWSRLRSRTAFARRLSRSGGAGAVVTLAFRGLRLYVVARRGPLGGRALVLIDGRRRGTINLRARRTRNRAVVFTRGVNRRRPHRLTLVAVGPRFYVDAFAFRR